MGHFSGQNRSVDSRFRKTSGREAFTGHELILKGALEAGVSLLTGYPGSPVADVFEAAEKEAGHLRELGVVAEIAGNEALAAGRLNGAQMAGIRAMAVMKSVGFNVAADGLFTGTLALHGHRGGGVIVVGDDPWNDSTQVPQDSRRLSDHLIIPSLEPATFQEVKDFIPLAFELSRLSDLYVSVIVSTNLADGGGVVEVRPNLKPLVSALEPLELDSSKVDPTKSVLLPSHTGVLEKEAYEVKLPAARRAARDLGINFIVPGKPGARLGFVAAGLPYAYLRDMLRDAGLEGEFPVLKLGMTYPVEAESVLDFARGLDEIVVVENKRAFIETQVRDLLVRAQRDRVLESLPAVWGKELPEGLPGIPAEHGMNPSVLLKRLGPFLERRGLATERMRDNLAATLEASELPLKIPARTATFCAGCPHRDTSDVFLEVARDFKDSAYMKSIHGRKPVDLIFHGDSGCYSMLFLPPNERLMQNYSGMGLGGGTAAGMDPFVSNKSVAFIGDGTFFHSGLAAVSDSIKNGVDILYVVLDNKTVAMTGHQPHNGTDLDIMGASTYAQDCEQALLGLTQGSGIPVVRFDPELRDDYRRVIEELLLVEGPKFLIADKECGITAGRRRRRAQSVEEKEKGFVAREVRVVVNEDVCEHCLECTVRTGCPGLDFVDTLHGPKVTTHLSNCVSDGACYRIGACPSFATVVLKRRGPVPRPAPPTAEGLPVPAVAPFGPDGLWRAYMAGIGGMGVGATTAVLVRAAQEEGLHVQFCDKKGLAIRNGGVYSHLTVSRSADAVISPVLPYATADLLLGVDLLEAARGLDARTNLRVASPKRTFSVVNTAKNPTIKTLMGKDDFSPAELEEALRARTRPGGYFSFDVSALSQTYLGSMVYDNILLMGVALQRGLLPLSLASFEKALRTSFSGLALERNLQALTLGRDLAVHPERYASQSEESLESYREGRVAALRKARSGSAAAAFSDQLRRAFDAWPLEDERERKHLILCLYELNLYAGRSFAENYLQTLLGVVAKDTSAGGWKASRAAARGLYRAIAIKDEVWVSELLTSPEKRERDAKRLGLDLGRGDTLRYGYHNRPEFVVLGMRIAFQIRTKDWMLKIMRRAGFLRRLLPSWHKRDRDFRDWYLALVKSYPGGDDPRWLELLAITESVKGFRDVRYRAMEKAQARAAEILGSLG
jgi:indolepyruvate ferredoxin oxidoreductase